MALNSRKPSAHGADPPAGSPPLRIECAGSPRRHPNLLAAFAFGGAGEGVVVHDALPLLSGGPVYEAWYARTPVESGAYEDIAWRASPELLFGSLALPLGADPVASTRALYGQLLRCVADRGYPHLLRVWNYLPQINTGEGDTERYKCFTLGRAQAFDEHAGELDCLPAATAIGTQAGDRLLVYFLAARSPGRPIENPRQVSAFEYPRRYGPRSPLFSRAMRWPRTGSSVLLASGTASIVGHESRHPDDVDGQLWETWSNLERLRSNAGAGRAQALRVYIRRDTDYGRVRAFLTEQVVSEVPVVYLNADICRSELLVEIEAVYNVPADPVRAA